MTKLQKFKKDNKKISTKNMIVSLSIIMCLLIVVVITKSYAIYKMQKEFDVIKNQIGNYSMGDVRVAVLVDGKETDTFPSYETNYKVESIECSNGVNAYWNVENWELRISDMSATSTKCTLSFNSKETNETTPVSYTKEELIALNDEYQNVAYENLKTQLLNDTYPVGSIYMSTEDDTVEKVQERFGGTWVKYAEDMTLVGASETKEANSTGGSSTTVLTNENMPEHSHVIPSLKVSTWSGSHRHSVTNYGGSPLYSQNTGSSGSLPGMNYSWTYGNAYPLYTSNSTITVSGQTTTESNTTTCTNCSATPINVQNPYVAVYMYKRTA